MTDARTLEEQLAHAIADMCDAGRAIVRPTHWRELPEGPK